MRSRSSLVVGLGAVTLAGCSSDGRELQDPVFDLPAPPVTEPVAASVTVPLTLPPTTDTTTRS